MNEERYCTAKIVTNVQYSSSWTVSQRKIKGQDLRCKPPIACLKTADVKPEICTSDFFLINIDFHVNIVLILTVLNYASKCVSIEFIFSLGLTVFS